MMESVVINPQGTGRRAKVAGYSVGGKTGSAQIFDFATKHYTHTYNGSFVGFAPVTNPAIVVVVTLNGTHGESGFGGVAAAPVFHEVATEALRVMEVPKDLPDQTPPTTLVTRNVDLDDSVADSGADGPNILEDEEPEPATVENESEALPRAPNFVGKTMRNVLAEAAAKGLTVLPDGSGVARVQVPAPGAVLRQGERIRVQFSR
jgi:cell division protein FtsI (penicillin-binding protein 3)